MKILITGAGGFVGRNLTAALEAVRDHKDMSYQGLEIDRIFSFTHKDSLNTRKQFCEQADFIFHLAGVNRPEDPSDYELGNRGLTEFPFSTWRPETAARMSAFLKRRTGVSLISSAT